MDRLSKNENTTTNASLPTHVLSNVRGCGALTNVYCKTKMKSTEKGNRGVEMKKCVEKKDRNVKRELTGAQEKNSPHAKKMNTSEIRILALAPSIQSPTPLDFSLQATCTTLAFGEYL